jgi:hypothetical protein
LREIEHYIDPQPKYLRHKREKKIVEKPQVYNSEGELIEEEP